MRHKYRIDDLEEELTKIKNKVKILESENQDLKRNLEILKNNTIHE
jgi:chaperonin cofactor prefoldin